MVHQEDRQRPELYSTANQDRSFRNDKGDAPEEYPRNLELLASSSQTRYLQIFVWYQPRTLEAVEIWGRVSTVRPDGKCYMDTYHSSKVSTSCSFLVLPAA